MSMKAVLNIRIIMILAFSLALSGCWLESNSSSPRSGVTIIHAVADAPKVNVRVNDSPLVEGADFKQARQLQVRTGNRSVAVDALLPGDDTLEVIGPVSVDLDERLDYRVIAIGRVADSNLDAYLITDDGQRESSSTARVNIAHLAAAAPEVDIYVTPPGDDLTGAEPLTTLSFPDDTGPVEVPAGEYQVRITAANDDAVLFDSGTVPLSAGADLLIGAVDNTGFGDAPVSLIVENAGEISEIFDVDAQAGVRAVHNSYDAPNVDIYVDEISGTPPIQNLAFPNPAPGSGNANVDYAALPPAETDLIVTATGLPNEVVSTTLDLVNGQAYTVLASGPLAGIKLLDYEDDNRSVATAARLRVIHGASQAPNVDVYLVEQGAGIGNSDPVLTDVPYEASSGYLDVAEGDYEVIVTPTGTGTAAIGPVNVSLLAGGVYTVVAREDENFDTSGTFTVTTLDDF